MDYKLRWSVEALRNFQDILEDIEFKWTNKEVGIFKLKLSHQLDLIIQNPFMFPASSFKPGLRKAVLSKQTTIFYRINDNIIYLTYLHINRKDIGKLK